MVFIIFFFFQAEDGIRDGRVTGVQTCALPISNDPGVKGLMYKNVNLGELFVSENHQGQVDKVWRRWRMRSEERRVGKECRSRWSPYDEKKKRKESRELTDDTTRHITQEQTHAE